jgi:hypothetical protein
VDDQYKLFDIPEEDDGAVKWAENGAVDETQGEGDSDKRKIESHHAPAELTSTTERGGRGHSTHPAIGVEVAVEVNEVESSGSDDDRGGRC